MMVVIFRREEAEEVEDVDVDLLNESEMSFPCLKLLVEVGIKSI